MKTHSFIINSIYPPIVTSSPPSNQVTAMMSPGGYLSIFSSKSTFHFSNSQRGAWFFAAMKFICFWVAWIVAASPAWLRVRGLRGPTSMKLAHATSSFYHIITLKLHMIIIFQSGSADWRWHLFMWSNNEWLNVWGQKVAKKYQAQLLHWLCINQEINIF